MKKQPVSTNGSSNTEARGPGSRRFISVKEFKRMFGIGNDLAYELVHMENFPSQKIGGIWRIDQKQVVEDFREAPADVDDLKEMWE